MLKINFKIFSIFFASIIIGLTTTEAQCSSCISSKVEVAPNAEILSREKLSNLYTPRSLYLLQIMMGTEGIISQGGIDSTDRMFSNIELNGKNILDVGSGFGGVDIYLAKNYDVNIIGVDREPYMIKGALELVSKECDSIRNRISFQTLNNPTSLEEFPDNTFDIVFSKEALYHVPLSEKQNYINEMIRVLKPDGKIIIADFLKSLPEPGENLKRAAHIGTFCHFVSPKEFLKILEKANLYNICFNDVTERHVEYTTKDIERFYANRDRIIRELGIDSYNNTMDHIKLWLIALETHELIAGIFVGTK